MDHRYTHHFFIAMEGDDRTLMESTKGRNPPLSIPNKLFCVPLSTMLWVKRKKMTTPSFTCAATSYAKRKLLKIDEDAPLPPAPCELKRELTLSQREVDALDPPHPHIKEHPSDTEIEDREIESFSPGLRKSPPELYPDIASQQNSDTYAAAHEEMTIQQCRDFLKSQVDGYNFKCVCEMCSSAFDGIDPDFILCPACEDKLTNM